MADRGRADPGDAHRAWTTAPRPGALAAGTHAPPAPDPPARPFPWTGPVSLAHDDDLAARHHHHVQASHPHPVQQHWLPSHTPSHTLHTPHPPPPTFPYPTHARAHPNPNLRGAHGQHTVPPRQDPHASTFYGHSPASRAGPSTVSAHGGEWPVPPSAQIDTTDDNGGGAPRSSTWPPAIAEQTHVPPPVGAGWALAYRAGAMRDASDRDRPWPRPSPAPGGAGAGAAAAPAIAPVPRHVLRDRAMRRTALGNDSQPGYGAPPAWGSTVDVRSGGGGSTSARYAPPTWWDHNDDARRNPSHAPPPPPPSAPAQLEHYPARDVRSVHTYDPPMPHRDDGARAIDQPAAPSYTDAVPSSLTARTVASVGHGPGTSVASSTSVPALGHAAPPPLRTYPIEPARHQSGGEAVETAPPLHAAAAGAAAPWGPIGAPPPPPLAVGTSAEAARTYLDAGWTHAAAVPHTSTSLAAPPFDVVRGVPEQEGWNVRRQDSNQESGWSQGMRAASYPQPQQQQGGANEAGWWTPYEQQQQQQQQQHARLPDAAAAGPSTVFLPPPPPSQWDPWTAAAPPSSSMHHGAGVPIDAAQERRLRGSATAGTTRSTPVSSSIGALPNSVGPLGGFGPTGPRQAAVGFAVDEQVGVLGRAGGYAVENRPDPAGYDSTNHDAFATGSSSVDLAMPPPPPPPAPAPPPADTDVDADAHAPAEAALVEREYFVFDCAAYDRMVHFLTLEADRSRVADMHAQLRSMAPQPAQRKRWRRLQSKLRLVGPPATASNDPRRFRQLAWRDSDLIIAPREEWDAVLRECHRSHLPVGEHLSTRQTLLRVRQDYETRRSRCGITPETISAFCHSCRCYRQLVDAVQGRVVSQVAATLLSEGHLLPAAAAGTTAEELERSTLPPPPPPPRSTSSPSPSASP
ncbi:hypothetical protein GGF31_001377 [Allomyces arbusculus]|nr:hypothetical protein GGF31_001377 [Allomyces arbusculus]